MLVSFVYPTAPMYSGGVAALFEFANALARRGHEVHFLHGPAITETIRSIEEVDWFTFEPTITHHIAPDLEEPGLPAADVVFSHAAPARLGLPATFIQGHRMIPEVWERATFRAPCPKFCVATWLVDVGLGYGVPSEQLIHLPLGLDHDLFRVIDPVADRPYDVAVLYGAGHPAKAWDVAVSTLEEVRRQRPDLRVVAFSVPEPRRPLPDWITYEPDPERSVLAQGIYNAAKVFLQPSHWEGFGFTAVEAMACGAALVTTDNGGSRDYAVPGVTALVAPPGDTRGLAAAVEHLLADDAGRQRVAAAGAEYVRRFDWSRSGELLEGHLLRYLADPATFQQPPQDDRVQPETDG